MTNEELPSVAEIVDRLVTRFHKQAAEHEAKMVEHRAAFGARTEADAQIIAKLRAEIESLKREERATYDTLKPLVERVTSERDALRAEVAALQERLRASIARGDFAQMEISALKSQTPKGHPVKVGEWVRRTTRGSVAQIGAVGTVMVVWSDAYQVQLRKGFSTMWAFDDCTPCDPPTEATHDTPEGRSVAETVIRNDRNTDPKPGDTVRLVRVPSRADVSPELQTTLEWPWIERWGTLNQTALVVEPAYQLDGALSVCLSTNVHVRWPISCIEVTTEATHDTEAGKAAAKSAASEPIKVGDTVQVFKSSSTWTSLHDIGKYGTVSEFETDVTSERIVHLREHPDDAFGLCDVRKVTTQEMVLASMEYVKILGCRIRRTEVQRDDWKLVAQSHADELIKLRQHVDALKAERDAEREALGIQAAKEAGKALGMVEGEGLRAAAQRVVKERDALRTECDDLRRVFSLVHGSLGIRQGEHIGNAIDALKKERDDLTTRLRQSIARGDFAEMRLATLTAEMETERERHKTTPGPRTHPVKVGEWLRKTTDGLMYKAGERFRLTSYEIIDGKIWCNLENGASWLMSVCEPCDPPHTEPVPKRAHPVAVGGYLRRLTGFNTTPAGEVARVTLVDDDDPSQLEYEVVRPNGQKGRWSAKGCEPCDPSATHDTPEGRSVAESVIRDDRKTEPADEIKVGDVVEVFQSTASCTFKTDIGTRGTVLQLDDSCVDTAPLDGFLAPKCNHVALCDVRKVTT